jgi:acetolactate synthase-1/2/3 large subunit
MLEPVTKWTTRVQRAGAIPEIVAKAFRVAQLAKPGPTHIELPEDVAATIVDDALVPLAPSRAYFPEPTDEAIAHAASLIASSSRPIVLAGNGVLRRHASPELRAFARGLHVPVAVTFMGKGAMDDRSHLSLMAVGLQARDHVLSGFDRSDLVVAVGYDQVEYSPERWNPDGRTRIVHIDTQPSEVDAAYRPEVELIGDIGGTLRRLLEALLPQGIGGRDASQRHESREVLVHADLRQELLRDLRAYEADDGWPIRPQKAIADLRAVLAPEDVVVSDVGAHKIWVARLYQAYEPNTVIISNGFASMGIALPGAIAAALVHPDRHVVALCGDGGLLMNVQELETAVRLGVRITIVVWRDDGYGLIDWKQRNAFGRPFGVSFGNPDFVALARSFGVAAFRPASAAELAPLLRRALDVEGPSLVEVPIDYRENLRLTEHLGALDPLA